MEKIKYRITIQRNDGLFLNRKADGYVKEFDQAIRFPDMADASEWLLNSMYAPKDVENYRYRSIKIVEILEGEEDVQEK